MAWKRGVKNNQEGVIQKGKIGHIKEYLAPSSRSSSVFAELKVLSVPELHSLSETTAFPEDNHGFPDVFKPFVDSGMVYLHAHEHARSVLSVIMHTGVAPGCILLSEAQLVNSKVCTGDTHKWTVYQGESFAYDAREGVIGDTKIRYKGNRIDRVLNVMIHVRRRDGVAADGSLSPALTIDGAALSSTLVKKLYQSVVTVDDIYIVPSTDPDSETSLVCRVAELSLEQIADDDSNDAYRGIVTAETKVFIDAENKWQGIDLLNAPCRPSQKPLRDEVQIMTSDEETFPVLRRLLRPCIALTSLVQAGFGKYKQEEEPVAAATTAGVDIDACTFDRVLLYLEHAARGEAFLFDPLLAGDLLVAAQKLGIAGLCEICQKVLGNFQDRVRKTPIRLEEVISRNHLGTETAQSSRSGGRSDTWLILDGMVLDVSRWLSEHPGGSTIIPEQALDKDCTVFFEIYHASRQSFLYLKEFYIGELHPDDLVLLDKGGGTPSAAFLDELKRLTPWRLRPEDMLPSSHVHKSF